MAINPFYYYKCFSAANVDMVKDVVYIDQISPDSHEIYIGLAINYRRTWELLAENELEECRKTYCLD